MTFFTAFTTLKTIKLGVGSGSWGQVGDADLAENDADPRTPTGIALT